MRNAACASRGSDLFVESTHADLYAAVDALMDKLDRIVVRHRTRCKTTRPAPSSAPTPECHSRTASPGEVRRLRLNTRTACTGGFS